MAYKFLVLSDIAALSGHHDFIKLLEDYQVEPTALLIMGCGILGLPKEYQHAKVMTLDIRQAFDIDPNNVVILPNRVDLKKIREFDICFYFPLTMATYSFAMPPYPVGWPDFQIVPVHTVGPGGPSLPVDDMTRVMTRANNLREQTSPTRFVRCLFQDQPLTPGLLPAHLTHEYLNDGVRCAFSRWKPDKRELCHIQVDPDHPLSLFYNPDTGLMLVTTYGHGSKGWGMTGHESVSLFESEVVIREDTNYDFFE